jgi:hypothetical protein
MPSKDADSPKKKFASTKCCLSKGELIIKVDFGIAAYTVLHNMKNFSNPHFILLKNNIQKSGMPTILTLHSSKIVDCRKIKRDLSLLP